MGTHQLSTSFLKHFEALEDPRIETENKLHHLKDMLVLTILAVLCGAEGWVDIELFGKSNEGWLKTFLELPNGIPSHDTLGRVFAYMNASILRACFLSWMQSLVKVSTGNIIAIDGKTLRRSHDKGKNKAAIHMVSAFSSANSLVLGQLKTKEKSNEITAIPELLDMLDIAGGIITIDAMGCQTEIAKKIVEKKADYVFGLKGNQGNLHKDVQLFLESVVQKKIKGVILGHTQSIEKDHGRIEKRQCWITDQIDWLEKKDEWKGLRSIAMIESTRKIGDHQTVENRFYITSLEPNAEKFASAVRDHWDVENQLHWTLDVTFREDECRIRTEEAPENFAVIRHIVFNLLKQEKSTKLSMRAKRKRAGWDRKYLTAILAASGF